MIRCRRVTIPVKVAGLRRFGAASLET